MPSQISSDGIKFDVVEQSDGRVNPYWFPVMSTPRLELLANLPAHNNLLVLIESSRAIIMNSQVSVGNDSKLLVNEVAHKDDLSKTRNWVANVLTTYKIGVLGCFSQDTLAKSERRLQ